MNKKKSREFTRKNAVKISIVVPIFNLEEHLEKSLKSLVEQTLREIEIICVDDFSTDGSREVVKKFSDEFDFVKLICLSQNSSANIARKRGVEAASGEYLLFVDGDDTLEPNACEFLYAEMKANEVDILNFGANVINRGNLPENRIKNMMKFVAPYIGELFDQDIVEACFVKKQYQFNLWNKLFKTSVVKNAFANCEELILPKGQDKYQYLLIADNAKSYRGISNAFYNYNFGSGVTGHNQINLGTFEKYCKMGLMVDASFRYMEKTGIENKQLMTVFVNDILRDCISNMLMLPKNEVSRGFDMLSQYFQASDIVSNLSYLKWFERGAVADLIKRADVCKVENREIKVIGTFYHRLDCGGVQMVLAKLAKLWDDMGYQVVVFTDKEPSDDEYSLPENVKRIVIPSSIDITKDRYGARAKALEEALIENKVDVMVYHAWTSNVLFWDLLLCKMNSVKFIIHSHNIFSLPLITNYLYGTEMPHIYAMADEILTLNKTDSEYWINFNSNVTEVINPSRYEDIKSIRQSTLVTHNIIWSARISAEKRPQDAIEIFREVHRQVPTARLFILGKATDTAYFKSLKKRIEEYGLENDINLFGFQKDVQPFLELSSLMLMTSEYEGAPLSLAEGMLTGLPVVSYEMPYLMLMEKGEGIVTIEQGNVKEAANAIVEILKNDEYRKTLGEKARKSSLKAYDINYEALWSKILDNLKKPHKDKDISMLWGTLWESYRRGNLKLQNRCKELENNHPNTINAENLKELAKYKEENRKLTNEIAALKTNNKILQSDSFHLVETRKSFTYKLGRFFTFVPRLIRHVLFKKPM